MKAQHLYIVNMEGVEDREAAAVADGLWTKYLSRCETLTKYVVGGTVEDPVAGSRDGDFGGEVGAYVVMHGLNPDLTFTPVQDVFDALRKALGERFPQLGRVVMVTCNLMPAATTQEPIDDAEESSYFVFALLAKLNAAGLRPNIVGWDCFVSALPFRPNVPNTVTPVTIYKNPKSRTGPLQDAQLQTMPGHKIVKSGTSYGLATQKLRTDHKRGFQVCDGTDGKPMIVLSHVGWSQQV